MATQNLFILTAANVTTAQGLDTSESVIQPRAIDNTSPGVGINLNNAAVGVAAGASVALIAKFAAPKRIVDDAAYPQALKDFLLTLPFALLEAETIYAPVSGDG